LVVRGRKRKEKWEGGGRGKNMQELATVRFLCVKSGECGEAAGVGVIDY
jgi:hypothetical protein